MKGLRTIVGYLCLAGILLVNTAYSQIFFIEMTGRVTDSENTGLGNMRIEVFVPADQYCQMYLEELGWDGAVANTIWDGTYEIEVPWPCYLLVVPKDPNGQSGTFHFEPGSRIVSYWGPFQNVDFVRIED